MKKEKCQQILIFAKVKYIIYCARNLKHSVHFWGNTMCSF